MAPASNAALAQAVRDLRANRGLTQEQLGRAAGYRAGAGVSISRLESGLLRPGPERFAGVARALGLTPDDLEALAQATTVGPDPVGPVGTSTAAPAAAPDRGKAPPGQRELNARRERIELEIGRRTAAITERSEAFNQQHDRADDEFAARLRRIAGRVDGAPQPPAAVLPDGGGTAGAPATGPAGRGAMAPGAGTAFAKRAAVGTAVLAGIAALPVVALFAGGVMIQRNRTQRREFAEQLDAADAELVATGPGVLALEDILRRAAEILAYLATHGGHALARWEDQLGPAPTTWDALGRAGQARYRDFLALATAQEQITSFDFPAILTARGPDQDTFIAHADQVLTASDAAVRSRV